MTQKVVAFADIIRGIEAQVQKSESNANTAVDRVSEIRKRLRTSEQRHRSIVNNLNNAEGKTAELSQQQLKTKKKLCVLYSRLQSFISRDNDDDLSSAMEIKSAITNTEILKETYLLSWWRISILKSFDVGSWQQLQRHVALRKGSGHSVTVEELNESASLTIPLCQYFLFGKCLDEKCVFLHPSEGRASVKSRSKYIDWISAKHCQIQSNTKADRESSAPLRKSHAMSQNNEDSNNTDIKMNDGDRTKRRYFSTQNSNSPIFWTTLFIDNCSRNMNRNGLLDEILEETLPSETIKFRRFCTNILFVSKFQDPDQRSINICSHLENLRVLLDSPNTGRDHLHPSCAGDVQAWSLYLVLLLESKILEAQPQSQFWSELIGKLKEVFSQSLTVMALAVTVSNQLNNGIIESIEEPSSLSALFSILHAVGRLEEMCKEGKHEVVIDMLCRYLEVPEFFQSEIKDISELEWEINCIPRKLAFAILLVLLVTGKFIGTRLMYIGNEPLFMEEKCNINSRKSVRALFLRCPLFRTRLADILSLAVDEMSESTKTIANCDTATSSRNNLTGIFTEKESLCASEQSIWWCYLIVLSSCDELNSGEFERCVNVCDPLHYPGVYEALQPSGLPLIPGVINLSNTVLNTLNTYSYSTTASIEDLEIAYISLCNNGKTSDQLLLHSLEKFPIVDGPVEMFWNTNLKVYNDAAASSIDLISHVSWWIIVGKTNNLFQANEIHRFSSLFSSLCTKDKRTYPTVMLFRQVFIVVKEISCTSKSRTICIDLLTMLISVIEATIGRPSTDSKNPQDKMETMKEHNSDNLSLEVAGYWSGFDCAAPLVQHRFLISILRYMQTCQMISYSTIEFILKSSLITLHGPEVIVRWILDWFSDPTCTGVDQCDRPYSRPSLKVSSLVANAFNNAKYLSSPQSLARLSPDSLYDLGLHFLRSEYFEIFSKIQQVLDDMPQVPRAALFASLLRMHSLPQELVCKYYSSKIDESNPKRVGQSSSVTGNSGRLHDIDTRVFPLEEESLYENELNNSIIQRFHDAIVTYRSNCNISAKKSLGDVSLPLDPLTLTVVDLSGMMGVDRKLGIFPFQSLALFSDTITELLLSNNFLNSIPLSICALTKLQKLNLSNNSIDSIPHQITSSCSQIKILNLAVNKFTTFPSAIFNLSNLEDLKINGNLIEYIPNQIDEMKKLQSLDISDNRLKVVKSFTRLHFFAT